MFDLATFSDTYRIPKLSSSWYEPNLPSIFCHFWFSPQRWLLDQERGVSVVEGKQLTVVQPPAEAAAPAIPLPQPAAVEAAEEALPHMGSIFPESSPGFCSSAPSSIADQLLQA